MPLPDLLNPSPELVDQLRQMFKQKMEKDVAKIPQGGFHEQDLNKVLNSDVWLTKFLENNVLNLKDSLKQVWDTCVWRKTANINEICEDNIRMDYVRENIMFPRGKDIDGKTLFIFRSRMYTRGSRSLDDMKRVFLYWMERLIREANDDYITIVFELTDAGLSNVDMDYVRYIITTLKNYYPYSLNYILVYDLPWILNATFQIIKRLLPANAVDRLKNINQKNIREYIDESTLHVTWGGEDNTEFEFVSERRDTNLLNNNNSITHNNNLKKVHFANLSPSESPMNVSSFTNCEKTGGEMLRIVPHNAVAFTKLDTDLVGTVDIINIAPNAVTYKIKTTAPEKFRVRPSTGVLSPGDNAKITVVLQKGQQIKDWTREKFLVLCMSFDNETSTNTQELVELWKNTAPNVAVEEHRLKCVLPAIMDESDLHNGVPLYEASGGDMYSSVGSAGGGDKQYLHYKQMIIQLSDTTQRMERQIRRGQKLQWCTFILIFILSMATVYILKAEIRSSASQYCLKH